MPLIVDIKMLGDKELERQLAKLPEASQKKPVRSAMRGSNNRLKKAIVAAAPVATGKLKAALVATKVKSGRRSRSYLQSIWPLPRRELLGIPQDTTEKKQGYYPTAVEYGTKTCPPQSYVRATVNAMHDAEVAKISDDIGKGIIREAKRLAGKGIKVKL